MRKYDPIIWATIEDAQAAQEIESHGWKVLLRKNAEGYLEVIGARKTFGCLKVAA